MPQHSHSLTRVAHSRPTALSRSLSLTLASLTFAQQPSLLTLASLTLAASWLCNADFLNYNESRLQQLSCQIFYPIPLGEGAGVGWMKGVKSMAMPEGSTLYELIQTGITHTHASVGVLIRLRKELSLVKDIPSRPLCSYIDLEKAKVSLSHFSYVKVMLTDVCRGPLWHKLFHYMTIVTGSLFLQSRDAWDLVRTGQTRGTYFGHRPTDSRQIYLEMRVDMYRTATEWVGAQSRCPKWELYIKFDRYDHPVVLTVEAQVKYVGHLGGGLSKNLFLKKQRFHVISALADTTVDMKGFRIDVHALKPDFN
ncbi:hypothetical protein Syun_027623 [Stephania yunnanensis]|uniref:Uncharacterized protein n=1 Tax=Stephania yunnanensis TaxID=152371 RepID=A0AAP0HQ41_9MAGN